MQDIETDLRIQTLAQNHLGKNLVQKTAIHSPQLSIIELESLDEESKIYRVVASRPQRAGELSKVQSVFASLDGKEWEQIELREELSPAIVEICKQSSLDQNIPDEEDDVIAGFDIGFAISNLSRDQLELLIVRLIAANPEQSSIVLEECRKPIDSFALDGELRELLMDGGIERPLFEDLETLVIAKAQGYVLSGDYHNALRVLDLCSGQIVHWIIEQKKRISTDTDFKRQVENTAAALETLWEDTLKLLKEQDYAIFNLKKTFRDLASLRQDLTPILGPIFSDPLRRLKVFIEKCRLSRKRKQFLGSDQDEIN